jgi:transcription elongation GreA/GreB family factor
MTSDAITLLIDEIARLRQDLVALTGGGLEEGIVRLPVANAERRLQTLTQVLDAADVVEDEECVAIGRRVTLHDDDGERMSCAVVFPGDGDPANGWIGADSPLGAAILGARPGETCHVRAPAGDWRVTVVSVG